MAPSPEIKEKTPVPEGGNNQSLMLFMSAVLDLSWRMAIVVLLPIIGGFELDKHLGTSPSFTILGFILAMAGTFVVLKQMLADYGDKSVINSSVSNTKDKK